MHYSSDKQMQTISQTARLSRSCSNWVNPSPNPTAQAHAALRSTKINAKSNRAGETRSETAAARQHNARSIAYLPGCFGGGRGGTSAGNWAQRRSQRKTALRFMKRRRLLWTRSTIRVSIARRSRGPGEEKSAAAAPRCASRGRRGERSGGWLV